MSTQAGTAEVLTVVETHRRALLAREDQAVRRLLQDHHRLARRIEEQARELTDRIGRARSAGEVVRPSWLHTQGRLAQLEEQVRQEVDVFARGASGAVSEYVQEARDLGQRAAGASVATALGVSPEVVAATLPSGALQGLGAVTRAGAPVGRILAEIAPQAAANVREELMRGVALGENPRTIARRMRHAGADAPLARCRTIARTESLRAYRGANVDTWAAMDEVDGWVWVAAADSRCCGACWAMHGTEHPDGTPLESHPNCRCVPAPNVPGQARLVKPGADQLRAMDEAELARILGPRKAAALKARRIMPQDLVGSRVSPVWGLTRTEASLAGALRNARLRRRGHTPPPAVEPVVQPTPPTPPPRRTFAERARASAVDLRSSATEAQADLVAARLGRQVEDEVVDRMSRRQAALRQAIADLPDPRPAREARDRARDAWLARGQVLRAEFTRRDPEPPMGEAWWAWRKREEAMLEADEEYMRLKQEHRRLGEVYRDVADASSSSGRARLNRELAALQRDTLVEVLREVREVGGDLQAGRRTASVKLVQEAVQVLPRDWIEASNSSVAALRVTTKAGDRAYYSRRRIHLGGPDPSTALHEFGHAVQDLMGARGGLTGGPQKVLVMAEHGFLRRRYAGRTPKWLGSGYRKSEVAVEDEFTNPYIGKWYGDEAFTEVLSMGLEGAYHGRHGFWTDADPDWRRLILGLLAGA